MGDSGSTSSDNTGVGPLTEEKMYQTVNYNVTPDSFGYKKDPETGKETRQTLSAQGRAFSSPDGKDPLAQDDNGGNANGNYTPKGANMDGPVKPENQPKQKQITDFLSESQANEYAMGTRVGAEGPGSFLGDSDSVMGGALGAALGGGMGFDPATSPFDPKSRGRFQRQQGSQMESGSDATVEMQAGTATPGGEVGVGQQSFGQRALGGSDTVVENMAPPGAEQTEQTAVQAQSDLQPDPNVPPLTPQQAVIPDVNYVLPTANQKQVIAFSPNDPRAVYTARGPLSRNLISERSGFGRKFL